MWLSMLFLFLCFAIASSTSSSFANGRNHELRNNSCSRNIAFAALFLPRGGGSGNNNSNSNAPSSFGQQLEQYEQSMKHFLNHYEQASLHMKQVLQKTTAFHDKTNGAMDDLRQGMFKVAIQVSMLPSDLSKHFQRLHQNMAVLQDAATTMMHQLGRYIDLVTHCLNLVEGLVEEVRTKSREIPNIQKEEKKLQQSGSKEKKYRQLQHRVQEDMMYLQEISVSVREEVLEMDATGRDDIWPTFLENIKAVHEAALDVDRIFQAIREGRGSGGMNPGLIVPETSPIDNSMHSFDLMGLDDGAQELEVEMTTYQYSW